MRATTVVRKLLAVKTLFVLDLCFEVVGVVIYVRPRWRRPRCPDCQCPRPGYDQSPLRRWRHLALGRLPFFLAYAPRRVDCPVCGVVTEDVPWAAPRARVTRELAELTAYLAQQMDKTAVTRLTGLAWRTVGSIAERVVEERLDSKRFDNLSAIGIDEISFRKHHNYVTVVVDHTRRRVIWVGEGKCGDTLHRFFDDLGPERTANLTDVTMDMSQAYISVVQQRAPQARITFDRFHVSKLASDALDKLRRSEVRLITDLLEAKKLKGLRYALLKNPWNLTPIQEGRISDLPKVNRRIYHGHLFKEALAHLLDCKQPWRARRLLHRWISWAQRSRLAPFVKLSRTLKKHQDGIIAYVESGLSNGRVEGLNNKTRLITRRAFGFHGSNALAAMIYLCCGGIELNPPLPQC
jgi:transposase